MRKLWPFIAGIILGGLVALATLPIAAGVAALMAAFGSAGHPVAVMLGQSSLAVREEQGHVSVRILNYTYHAVSAPVAGEPKPRRILLRQQVESGDSDGKPDGRVQLDAWPLEAVADVSKPPLYTIHVPGNATAIGDDGVLWIERGARRAAYAAGSGEWLFDADSPVASFTVQGEARRFAALAAAEEDMPPRTVAVLAYASAGALMRRVLLVADDPMRARALRATVSAARLISRIDETGRRVLELPLPAGNVRLPLRGDDIDLTAALVPVGLGVVPVDRWVGRRSG